MLKAFSYFAKTALNNYSLDEIEETDLVGCYITANVTHEDFEFTKGTRKGQIGKSVRLSDYTAAAGFGSGESKFKDKAADTIESDEDDDLDAFLDD